MQGALNVHAVDEDGNTFLHFAVQERRGRLMEILLNKGANVNSVNVDGNTPLHSAAQVTQVPIGKVELLLLRGANINAVNRRGWTPLHFAAQDISNLELVTELLEKGANANVTNSEGNTPLHLAALAGSCTHTEALLKKGANIKAINKDGDTALNLAFKFGRQFVAKLLLLVGRDVNITDKNGCTPLHLTAYRIHDHSFVCHLLREGANIEARDKNGRTPLHWFAQYDTSGNVSVFKELLSKGAKIDARDLGGMTVLHTAAKPNRPCILKFLLEQGADVNAFNEDEDTPLHFAATRFVDDGDSSVRVLLEHGAHVNAVGTHGNTPLHLAAAAVGCTDSVGWLLRGGADVNAINDDGRTPFMLCISHQIRSHWKFGWLQKFELFLKNGAGYFHAPDRDGNTLLHFAAQHKLPHREFEKLMLFNKVNVNAINKHGYAPINLTTDSGFIRSLIESGADIEHTASGLNALHKAITMRAHDTVSLLLGLGIDTNLEIDKDAYVHAGKTALELAVSKRSRLCFVPGLSELNKIVLNLKKHIIKLEVAGMYVNQRDLSLLRKDYRNDLIQFEQVCRAEVSRLKDKKISPHLTLSNILISQRHPTFARNEQLFNKLLAQSFNRYPIYQHLIVEALKKSRARLELLTSSRRSLKVLLKVSNLYSDKNSPALPTEILEEIVSYLDNKDLHALNNCSKEIRGF